MFDIQHFKDEVLAHKATVALLLVGAGLFSVFMSRTDSQLAVQGEQATAVILDRSKSRTRRSASKIGRPKTLRYRVQLEITGRSGAHEDTVSRAEYDRAIQGSTVPVVYLPNDPNVFFVGSQAQLESKAKQRFVLLPLGLVSLLAGAGFGVVALKEKNA